MLQVAGADSDAREQFDTWLESPFEGAREMSERERRLTVLMGG